MTTIYLIRHGEAEGNAFRRLHGQYDSILTPNGFRQAEAVARRFQDIPVDACFSSDLTRTSLTARSIYIPQKLSLQRDQAFREVLLGEWEDVPFGYLERFAPQELLCFNRDPVHWHAQGAERFEEYTDRFIDRMRRAAEAFPGGTIAIFCHGSVLRGTLMRLFFHNDSGQVPYCDNTAVSKLFWNQGTFTYEYLNDNSHLPPELSTFARQKWWREDGKKDFNLYYLPVADVRTRPNGIPDPVPDCVSYFAMLGMEAVGLVSLSPGEDEVGWIRQLYLRPDLQGRCMEDQLLGQAVSVFRKAGCRTMAAKPQDVEPEEILERYGFVQAEGSLRVNIDPGVYQWQREPAAVG